MREQVVVVVVVFELDEHAQGGEAEVRVRESMGGWRDDVTLTVQIKSV